MSDQKRYNEKEIARIFEEAAKELEASRKQRLTGEGLSLSELQDIGADSGIPADFIARAAAKLYQMPATEKPDEKVLGIPVSIAHTLELPRMVTEEEWNALVVDLRTTFDAKGKIEQDGSFRQWTNGNLQILLEPIGKGSRLRMKSTKQSAKSGLKVGPFYTLLGLIFPLIMLFKGFDVAILGFFAAIVLLGWSVTGYYAMTTGPWASLRKSQMEAVAARFVAQMGVAAGDTTSSSKVDTLEAPGKPAISLDLEEEPRVEQKKRTQTRLRS